MQDLPICWKCSNAIESGAIFEALCGHDRCPSAVFHGLCLMEYREEREAETEGGRFVVVGLMMRRVGQEHTENG